MNPTAVTAPEAAVAGRAGIAVAAVFATNGVVLASFLARIPALRDDLGLSTSRLGLVLLAMAAGAMLALPTAGLVIARLGAARTVRFAVLVCAAGLALAGLAPNAPTLVAGLFLIGIGSGNWDVAMNVEGAEVERRLGRAIMPHLHAAFSIGTVAGALLGAGALAVGMPTSAHLGIIAVLVAASTWWACRLFLPVEPVAAGMPALRHPLAAWREPRTLGIGLLVLAFAFTEGSANDWLALALVDGYGVSNAVGVLGFAVFVTAMTVGRLLGARLLDRHGRVVVLRATALLAVAGLVLVIVGGSVVAALVGVVLWGLGASLGFPVGMSAGADDATHAAARVSVVSSIGYTAFLVGPPLIGFLADHVGVLASLWVVLAVLALGLLAAGATREPAPG